MKLYSFLNMFILALLISVQIVTVASAEQPRQSVQLKAGWYFPATKSFDVGNALNLTYSIKPIPYMAVEAGLGYYRAEKEATSFISALPLTISARAILPLQFIDIHVGGGGGAYYKMLQLQPHSPSPGLTELSADHTEFSFGYHANAGIEFPASNGLSLLLDGKYVYVDQGKFKSYEIRHDGAFVFGGFALSF